MAAPYINHLLALTHQGRAWGYTSHKYCFFKFSMWLNCELNQAYQLGQSVLNQLYGLAGYA